MNTKQQDVGLILKLYELRRDEMMRRARNWYVTEFQPEMANRRKLFERWSKAKQTDR